MNQIFYLTLLFILFISCSTDKKNTEGHFGFAGNECWKKNAKEAELFINQEMIDNYKKECALGNAELPLNKVISSEKNLIYIVVSLHSGTSQKLHNYLLSLPSTFKLSERSSQKENTTIYESLVKTDINHIYRIIYDKQKPDVTVLINIVGSTKSSIEKQWNSKSFLDEKLSCQ